MRIIEYVLRIWWSYRVFKGSRVGNILLPRLFSADSTRFQKAHCLLQTSRRRRVYSTNNKLFTRRFSLRNNLLIFTKIKLHDTSIHRDDNITKSHMVLCVVWVRYTSRYPDHQYI